MNNQVQMLLELCRRRGLILATAESCTAGSIAAEIASVAGASDVLDRGWIVYSNLAKQQELGVNSEMISSYGVVSREVVTAMAERGALSERVCIAVSGVAGPGGGTLEKPVGTVWMAVALHGMDTRSEFYRFDGDRNQVRTQAVSAAISLLIRYLES